LTKIKADIKFGKLKKLIEAMSKKHGIKVGLLADKGGSDERGEDLDNAGLGAIQEFGCDIKITQKMAGFLSLTAKELGLPKLEKSGDGYIHIPARSFLQMPLSRKNAIIKELKNQLDTKDVDYIVKYFIKTGDMRTLATMLGLSAKEIVLQAFETEGFGQWKPNSPFTVAMKGSSKPLLDTGELRQKIDFEVEDYD